MSDKLAIESEEQVAQREHDNPYYFRRAYPPGYQVPSDKQAQFLVGRATVLLEQVVIELNLLETRLVDKPWHVEAVAALRKACGEWLRDAEVTR